MKAVMNGKLEKNELNINPFFSKMQYFHTIRFGAGGPA